MMETPEDYYNGKASDEVALFVCFLFTAMVMLGFSASVIWAIVKLAGWRS